MRNCRLLTAIVVTIFASSAVLTHAQDTPAQAAARAALMQKMNELDTEQPPGSTNLPMAAPEQTAPPAVTVPPVETPTPQFSTNVPATTAPAPMNPESTPPVATPPPVAPQINQSQAAANAALTQKMNELNAEQPQGATNSVPQVLVVSPPLMAPGTNQAVQHPVNPPATQPLQTNMPPITVPPVETPTAPVISANQPAISTNVPPVAPMTPAPIKPPAATGFAPIAAPPLPISQDKQAQLQELLSRYMANQITPSQYQEERARILAQPN